MKKRIHLRKKYIWKEKKKQPWTKKRIVVTVICTFIFFVILSFFWIQKKVTPILLAYGESEMQSISKVIMNASVNHQVTNHLDINKLFIVSYDNNGEINTIDFDPKTLNQVLTILTKSVQENLTHLELGEIDQMDVKDSLKTYNEVALSKGVIYEIPSGVVFGNSILANLGPKIPVRFNLYGDISSELKTTITNYGINNAMLEASIVMTIEEQVILPFVSKKMLVTSKIPIAMKLIRGNIPEYYLNGVDKNSTTITVPKE